MHRFYIPPGSYREGPIELAEDEAHHAARVLRVRIGDLVEVVDGAGTQISCQVSEVNRHSVRLETRATRKTPAPASEVTLLQAVPKGKIIESIIQKATELGARRIVPLLSERVVTQLDDEGGHHKAHKWQHVAVEAIKQCGAPWLPAVEEPVTIATYLQRQPRFDLALVASLRAGSVPARVVFSKWQATRQRLPHSVCVWIGPEGDFSPAEYDAIEASGARPVSLGSLVLRVETAAVYCLSVIHHELHSAAFGAP